MEKRYHGAKAIYNLMKDRNERTIIFDKDVISDVREYENLYNKRPAEF